MIKQDNWIRAQCETPTHIYRKILGSVEYASAPFTQEQKYSMELQEFLVNLNSPLNAVPVPNLNISQDTAPVPTKPILGVGSITPITEEELRVWKPMIHPFSGGNIRYNEEGGRIVSKGLSSFGYDVTLANKFKVFTNVNGGIIDPLNMPENCYVEFEGEYCIIPPNSYLLGHTVEYFHIPDDVIVVCVGKSTLARCFAGDTKVQLADGTTPTFIELIKRAENGERLFGYSVDDRMQIAISELFSPRKIGTEEVLEVVLDNDEIIECTPDHKFLTKEGLEIKAEDLAPGDSLFPLYKIRSRGYEAIVQPNDWTLTPGHKLADEWNLRHKVYAKEENQHRHHINRNRADNRPVNIERKNSGDHIREHNQERHSDPVYMARISDIQKQLYAENAKDPEWVAKWSKQCSDAARLFWHDPKHEQSRRAHRDKILKYQNSPEGLTNREKKRQLMRLRMSTEERKREQSERSKTLWRDPEYRSMMTEQCRQINLREDITEKELIEALESEGSIRGAARRLNCDRTVFRRFTDTIAFYKEKWLAAKVTCDQFYAAMCEFGSATKAAQALEISKSYVTRHFQDAVRKFYNNPSLASNHKVVEIRRKGSIKDVYCLTAPEHGNFALGAGVFVNNCGAILNVTPVEPGFSGQVVIEISNSTNLPIKVYANQGVAQFLFLQGSERCSVSYADKNGKYQGQTGITTARV